MLRAFLKISNDHPSLLDKICELMGSSITFTQTDKDTIKELSALLEPFAIVTEKLESENQVTSSQVLPNIFGCSTK